MSEAKEDLRKILEPEASELEELMLSAFDDLSFILSPSTHPIMRRMVEITASPAWKDKTEKYQEGLEKTTPENDDHRIELLLSKSAIYTNN